MTKNKFDVVIAEHEFNAVLKKEWSKPEVVIIGKNEIEKIHTTFESGPSGPVS